MSLRMSNPLTRAVPEVGGKRPVSIDMVVDLPAPLWPSSAVICDSYMLMWILWQKKKKKITSLEMRWLSSS